MRGSPACGDDTFHESDRGSGAGNEQRQVRSAITVHLSTKRILKPETVLRARLCKSSVINTGLFLLIFILALIENEERNTTHRMSQPLSDLIRACIIVLSVPQVCLVVQIYRDCAEFQVEEGRLHPRSKCYTALWRGAAEHRGWLALEVLLHCLVLPPRVHYSVTTNVTGKETIVHLADYWFLVLILRGYHVLRMLFWMSRYTNVRARFFCQLQGVERQCVFFLKSTLIAHSSAFLASIWIVLSAALALCLRTVEKEVKDTLFESIWSGFWATIAAEELVGYGDIFPLTHFGRLLICLDIFLGISTLAFLLVIANTKVQLSTKETKFVKNFVFVWKRNTYLKKSGVVLLQRQWRLRALERQLGAKHAEYRDRVRKQVRCFRLERARLESQCTDNSTQRVEQTGKAIADRLHAAGWRLKALAATRHMVPCTQGFELQSRSFNHYSKVRSVFHFAKHCRRLYLDLMLGPNYREKRPSCFSQRNSAVSICSNLMRLGSIMAQEKLLRTLTGYESIGHSPRVSFEALRSVRDDTFFRTKTAKG